MLAWNATSLHRAKAVRSTSEERMCQEQLAVDSDAPSSLFWQTRLFLDPLTPER